MMMDRGAKQRVGGGGETKAHKKQLLDLAFLSRQQLNL